MEQDANVLGPQVPKRGRVAWNAFPNAIGRAFRTSFASKALATFTDSKAQPIRATKRMMMACPARDVPVARKNFVIEKKLSEFSLIGIELDKVRVVQWTGEIRAKGRKRNTKGESLKHHFHNLIFASLLAMASPSFAEIEEARDMMEAGQFEEAYDALWPAARSGNADAEELIGVMYALGLGVEKDLERAFEWYLRSSMKGHPGAQSGIGWYYEVGLGMPAPDLVRAYLWYALSAIGGDPDAAISLEEVVKKMTPEEIARAQVLIDDYKPWMYPFR